ncbi:MAG: PhoX family phosphatase [Sporichthyaceae bacterium]|nr:PhoX family phosphatase [Sporichthyaceae bacterium]
MPARPHPDLPADFAHATGPIPATGVPPARRLLPLAHAGGRDRLTCKYRCGDACFHDVPNTSDNPYFGDLLAGAGLSRRSVLRTGGAVALVAGAGVLADAGLAAAATSPGASGATGAAGATGVARAASGGTAPAAALTFAPVPPNRIDNVIVPAGYDDTVVVRWGDPVVPGAPRFDFEHQTTAAQLKQFGYNCDYVTLLPLGKDRALLVVNHEYTDDELMFHGYAGGATATIEQIRITMAAHGLSVVELQRVRDSGEWELRQPSRRHARYNRRLHTWTPYKLTGPAAGSSLLRTGADPTGTVVLGSLNNCSGGTTPWGTVLSGEENFNQYFVGGNSATGAAKTALARYGFDTTNAIPSGSRRWDRADSRFDIAVEPNEPNRFGWVIELDPFDPDSTPRKRTALGRFKHEAATVTLTGDRRPVAYLGDDERFDYIYKFVSNRRMDRGDGAAAHRHNLTLLDHGTLYVARLTGDSPAGEIAGDGALPADGEFDGAGEWIPLVSGHISHVPGMTAAEVLVWTRLAADQVGATKMDRPEDFERNPVNGRVYLACTNNSNRTAGLQDEANPLTSSVVAGGATASGNRNGHIVELEEDGDDPAALTFRWRIFMLCGDPNAAHTYFAGFDKSQVSPISAPDNIAFDGAGNLWIATDGNVLGSNDGLFAVPVDGPERGHLKQFLTVPFAAETCGPVISWDHKTVLVAVQHPGEVTGATPENPASRWPDGDQPRPAVVAVWRRDGRPVGT